MYTFSPSDITRMNTGLCAFASRHTHTHNVCNQGSLWPRRRNSYCLGCTQRQTRCRCWSSEKLYWRQRWDWRWGLYPLIFAVLRYESGCLIDILLPRTENLFALQSTWGANTEGVGCRLRSSMPVCFLSESVFYAFPRHSTYVEVLGVCNPDGTVKELKFTPFGENFGLTCWICCYSFSNICFPTKSFRHGDVHQNVQLLARKVQASFLVRAGRICSDHLIK